MFSSLLSSGHRVQGPACDRLVHGRHGPLRQGLPAAGQEAQVRDQGAQEELQPQDQPDLRLQEHPLRVSSRGN